MLKKGSILLNLCMYEIVGSIILIIARHWGTYSHSKTNKTDYNNDRDMYGISAYSITLFSLLVIFVLPEQLLDRIEESQDPSSRFNQDKKKRTSSLFEFDR